MHAPSYRHALAAGAALALTFTAAATGAQTWVGKRQTPALTEIVAIDATGEPGWLFGHEDLAGDGDATFKQPEQAIDVRTAYAATDNQKFWVRVYVSAPDAVGTNVTAYIFIDSDTNPATGGPAKATEIDPKLTTDPTAGGYEHVLGLRGNGTVANVWDWKTGTNQWVALNPVPSMAEAAAEIGKDTDPILVSGAEHGYLQGIVDLGLVGLTQACSANLFVRTTDSSAGGTGDLDVGKAASCVPGDSNSDNIPDIIVPVEGCTADDQCPGGGICADGKCVVAAPCLSDADCLSTEVCSPAGTCVPKPGPTCSTNTDCGDLVCVDGTCNACALGGDQCDSGHRCAPTGRCVVDSGSTSSTGAGVPLNPGDNVQGGAFACSASSRHNQSGPASLLLFGAGLIVARRRSRQRRRSADAR